jgi:hypothetical protein
MDSLTLTILIGIGTSLVASILFQFAGPLLKKFGKLVIRLLVTSSDAFGRYITKAMSKRGSKTYESYYFYMIIVVFLGVGTYFLGERIIEKTKLRNQIVTYLKKNNLELNGENYLMVEKDKLKEIEITKAERVLNDLPSMDEAYGVIIFLILLVLFLIIRVSLLLTIKNNVESFHKSLEIIRPNIGEPEYLRLRRDWLLMKTYSDYQKIVYRIKKELE